jgi:ABC-type lipoprotein release transport system permease subunit
MAVLALLFLPTRPPLGAAFLTAALLAAFGVAVLVVVAAMMSSRY